MKNSIRIGLMASIGFVAMSGNAMDRNGIVQRQVSHPMPAAVPYVSIPLPQYQMLVAAYAQLQQIYAHQQAQTQNGQFRQTAKPAASQNKQSNTDQEKRITWKDMQNAVGQMDTLTPEQLLYYGTSYEKNESDRRFKQACTVLLEAATKQQTDVGVRAKASHHLIKLTASKERKKSLYNLKIQCYEQKLAQAEDVTEKFEACVELLKIYSKKSKKTLRVQELCLILMEDPENRAANATARYYLSLETNQAAHSE